MQNWREWSYDRTRAEPPELTSAQPREVDDSVKRDVGVTKSDNTYRTSEAITLNGFNTYPVRHIDQPGTKWQTVPTDTSAYVNEASGTHRDITRTYKEGTIEASRDIARGEVRAWLTDWENSEFSHDGMIYDTTPDQERRMSVTNGRATINGVGFSTAWYAKDGTRVDFPNKDVWSDFYKSFHAHIEAGNDAFETAMSQIETALTTAELDTILAGLPAIASQAQVRSTGPISGAGVDVSATEPRIKVRR